MVGLVSIILPAYNAEAWLDECLESVAQQDFDGCLEVSIYNDASKVVSAPSVAEILGFVLRDNAFPIHDFHNSPQPKGVGYAKNRAILQSSGRYLCFLDSDDVMMPQRIRMQYEAALQRPQSVSLAWADWNVLNLWKSRLCNHSAQ
uniref:Glycosyltransferase 2-like domain-containing protein n=1 Tax=Xenopus tropicalis TaxID=8364 RepID=A0A803JDZ8_XENTR